jgi:hypothetical protein
VQRQAHAQLAAAAAVRSVSAAAHYSPAFEEDLLYNRLIVTHNAFDCADGATLEVFLAKANSVRALMPRARCGDEAFGTLMLAALAKKRGVLAGKVTVELAKAKARQTRATPFIYPSFHALRDAVVLANQLMGEVSQGQDGKFRAMQEQLAALAAQLKKSKPAGVNTNTGGGAKEAREANTHERPGKDARPGKDGRPARERLPDALMAALREKGCCFRCGQAGHRSAEIIEGSRCGRPRLPVSTTPAQVPLPATPNVPQPNR